MMNAISITKAALNQLQQVMEGSKNENCIGIRIGVKSGGCSGYKYYLEYAKSKSDYDEVIKTENGINVLIDPKALMYIIGSEMDYIKEQFKEGFTFNNPNEKAKCGCGKSFSV